MTIYVNGRFLTQRHSGMQRWAEQMLLALDARLAERREPPASPVIVLRPDRPARSPAFSHVQVRAVGRLSGHAWEQLELAAAARDGILVNLLSSGPLAHPRMISTFHDAAVMRHPELFSKSYRLLHRTLRPLLARRSQRLLTVSAFSAGELAQTLGVAKDRFGIAPNAADHFASIAARPEVLAENGLTAGAYGLCIGNQTPNKNVAAAIAAVERLGRPDLRLVLVGAGDARLFGGVDLAHLPFVLSLGYIDDAALKALYTHAAFLCFPSRYEGFGIPVLEAMSLGCPVIASDAGAVVETAGGAALHCRPDDIDGYAAAMAAVLDNPGLAQDLGKQGRRRATAFSWDLSAAVLERELAGLAEETAS